MNGSDAVLLLWISVFAVVGAYAASRKVREWGARWWVPFVLYVVLATSIVVSLISLALRLAAAPEPVLDHAKCVQYVWLDEDWKCVPWEEAG